MVTIFRDVRESGPAEARSGRCRSRPDPSASTRAAVGFAQPGDRLDQLGLAVALDAADADDLAAPDGQAQIRRAHRSRRARATCRSLRPRGPARPDVPAGGRPGGSPRGRPSARPVAAAVVSAVSRVPTVLPRRITVTRSLMAATSRSLCVMKMIVPPPARSRSRIDVELVDLLRRQQGGRLVEDQGPAALVERAQDLDPLLHADRQILDDLACGSTSESEFVGQLADALLGCIRGRA